MCACDRSDISLEETAKSLCLKGSRFTEDKLAGGGEEGRGHITRGFGLYPKSCGGEAVEGVEQ